MKFFCRPLPSTKTVAIIGLMSLMIGGCAEKSSDQSSESNEPATATPAPKFAAGTWKEHFKEAGDLFQEHHYHDMVRTLESTKAQAKAEAGGTLEYGKYLERLAKAHSWAVEYKPASESAIEAVNLFSKIDAPLVDKFAANWFAGIALTELKQYDKALPYLKKAQEISKDDKAGVGDSLAFLYKNLEECYKGLKDPTNLAAVQKEAHARLKH